MATAAPSTTSKTPMTKKLPNGTNVVLRPMDAGDATTMLAFARSLPEADVLFLRSDITDPEGIAYWVANIENGTTTSIEAPGIGRTFNVICAMTPRVPIEPVRK